MRDKQETTSIEIKQSLSQIKADPKETQKDLVEIANSSPDSEGWLIYGIAKNYTIVGMVDLHLAALSEKEAESCKQRFSQIAASTRPTAILYDWILLEREGKKVVAVRVKGREEGHFYQTSNGRPPFRVGDQTYFADENQIRKWMEEPLEEKPTDPAFTFAVIQIAAYLIAFSWFSVWILGQPSGWVVALVVAASAVIILVVYGKSVQGPQIVGWCRRTFPIFLTASIVCVFGSLGLAYTLSLYPLLSSLTFATYLTNAPTVSAYLLLATLGGGVLLDLPRLSRSEIGIRLTWLRHHRRFFLKGAALALLVMVVCANLAYVDSNLVLFTPKIGLVETRYATDGTVHIYQIELMTFGAWSQDQQIAHVMIPPFPLLSEEYYSVATNSSRTPSILSASGLSATILTPPTPGQDKIMVRLQSFVPSAIDPQFSIQFYSEFDVKQLAYIDLSPGSIIQQFPNGTRQWQRQLVMINHSAYDLRLERIVLYENGYAPTNRDMTFSPSEVFPHPDLSYENSTRTLALYGVLCRYGNLTVTVTYNSY
jgi:hypothetical protein